MGWVLFVGADVGVSALFALGYAARSVSPETEWRLQLAALALPPAAVAVSLASGVWLYRAVRGGTRTTWVVATAHMILAGAALVRFGSSVGGQALSDQETERFRVVTLNAGKGVLGSAAATSALILRARPDAIALQESLARGDWRVGSRPALVAAQQGYEQGSPVGEGVRTPLFTRAPVVTSRNGALGGEQGGVYTRVVLDWRGREIAIYNVHLRSFNPTRPTLQDGVRAWVRAVLGLEGDFVLRAYEAERLRDVLAREELPFIVTGDLNSTPHQWVYAMLSEGLQDATNHVAGWDATYPDRRPVVQIDAVLASPQWRVTAAEIGPEGLSDHRAVIAELELRDP